MKTAIIIDSTAYADPSIANHPDVYELKFTTTFAGGEEYSDSSDPILLQDFYEKLQLADQLPKTSQPAPGEYIRVLEEIVKKEYDQLLCIHLSGGLSGAYQTAQMIAEDYEDRLDIRIVDSKGAAIVIEGMIIQALEMLEQKVPLEEIYQKLKWVAVNSTIYLTVSDLENLVKGGRLPASLAKVGKMLKIKPLLCIGSDGKIQLLDQVRTDKKMNKRFCQMVEKDLEKYPNGIMLGFAHAMDEERMQSTMKEVLAFAPGIDCRTGVLGPVIGTHTGIESIGMGIIPIAKY